MTVQGDILREAIEKIEGDRNRDYGAPHEDFERTAALLNSLGYRGPGDRDITGSDWAVIAICAKLSRLVESPDHEDSVQDIAGYAGCYWEAREWLKKQAAERVEKTKTAFGVKPDMISNAEAHEALKAASKLKRCTVMPALCPGGSCATFCQMTGRLKRLWDLTTRPRSAVRRTNGS